VKGSRSTRAPKKKGEKVNETQAGRAPLFPEGRVSTADLIVGLANDVEQTAKELDELEKSARVRPEDLWQPISM
jgi:hypothetical protein